MLDYYDQFPAPDIARAKIDIRRRINIYVDDVIKTSDFITEEECTKIIDTAFDKHISNDIIKHSYTGWCVFGEPEVKSEVLIRIDLLIKTKKRRKLRGLLRTTYLLIKAHRQTIEKLYDPDNEYVQNVLKKNFESRSCAISITSEFHV